ncbi:MAG: hypothetical protein Roseis2KO_41170 [Roseivirga sp.]
MRLLTKGHLISLVLVLTVFGHKLSAQGNCEAMEEGSKEQRACHYGTRAIQFKQGSRESLLLFDSAISVNPDYAWAYYEKSITFLKRGHLTQGMQLLNKAVELDPLSYLTYRAYWFFQHRSFAYSLADLERYYAQEGAYQINTPGGALDMRIVLGITHAHTGDVPKAIELVKAVIASYPYEDYAGPYDFHTLGVLYLQNGQYAEAKSSLLKSVKRNEQFADTYYYLALIAEASGGREEAIGYLDEALLRYEGKKNGYTGYPFCFPVSKEMAEAKMKELKG